MSSVDDPHTFRMGLMQHLRELRKRLIISLIAVTLGAIVAMPVRSSPSSAPHTSPLFLIAR